MIIKLTELQKLQLENISLKQNSLRIQFDLLQNQFNEILKQIAIENQIDVSNIININLEQNYIEVKNDDNKN